MFYEMCKIIVSLIALVCYIILCVKTRQKLKYEKQEEITVYQSLYYKRLAFDFIADGCILALVINIAEHIITLKAGGMEIDYWCTLYAAAAKYISYKNNY